MKIITYDVIHLYVLFFKGGISFPEVTYEDMNSVSVSVRIRSIFKDLKTLNCV